MKQCVYGHVSLATQVTNLKTHTDPSPTPPLLVCQRQYDIYLERFRNLDYLEHELDLYNQSEQQKLGESEERLRRMQQRIRVRRQKGYEGEMERWRGDGGETKEQR